MEIEPQQVAPVKTRFRRIVSSALPVPESVPILRKIRQYEPGSAAKQMPVLWDRADGFQVYDAYGNCWLDWTSGVICANAGHAPSEVREAVEAQAQKGLHHSYSFPTALRASFLEKLCSMTGFEQAILATTGAEAVEIAAKIALLNGKTAGRNVLVSFKNAFHGRTLGAQALGGISWQKRWLPELSERYFHATYPTEDSTDEGFQKFLDEIAGSQKMAEQIAAVLIEPYQGSTLEKAPNKFMKQLSSWCLDNGILLAIDEVQSGFGRTGKLFAYHHAGISPDLVACGKGLSGGLPCSALLGSAKLFDVLKPGEVSSTHAGNPIVLAAALANLEIFQNSRFLSENNQTAELLKHGLHVLAKKHNCISGVKAFGFVAGFTVKQNDGHVRGEFATSIIEEAWKRGLLMFSPIGPAGDLIKISPPLVTPKDAILDGLQALEEAVVAAKRKLGGVSVKGHHR